MQFGGLSVRHSPLNIYFNDAQIRRPVIVLLFGHGIHVVIGKISDDLA